MGWYVTDDDLEGPPCRNCTGHRPPHDAGSYSDCACCVASNGAETAQTVSPCPFCLERGPAPLELPESARVRVPGEPTRQDVEVALLSVGACARTCTWLGCGGCAGLCVRPDDHEGDEHVCSQCLSSLPEDAGPRTQDIAPHPAAEGAVLALRQPTGSPGAPVGEDAMQAQALAQRRFKKPVRMSGEQLFAAILEEATSAPNPMTVCPDIRQLLYSAVDRDGLHTSRQDRDIISAPPRDWELMLAGISTHPDLQGFGQRIGREHLPLSELRHLQIRMHHLIVVLCRVAWHHYEHATVDHHGVVQIDQRLLSHLSKTTDITDDPRCWREMQFGFSLAPSSSSSGRRAQGSHNLRWPTKCIMVNNASSALTCRRLGFLRCS